MAVLFPLLGIATCCVSGTVSPARQYNWNSLRQRSQCFLLWMEDLGPMRHCGGGLVVLAGMQLEHEIGNLAESWGTNIWITKRIVSNCQGEILAEIPSTTAFYQKHEFHRSAITCNHNLLGVFPWDISTHRTFGLGDMGICKCHLILKALKSGRGTIKKLSFQKAAQHLELLQPNFSKDMVQTVQIWAWLCRLCMSSHNGL